MPGQAPLQQPATGLRQGGRDGPLRNGNPRRFAALPPPVLRGRKAELARAHAEAAALAPWKAAEARARMIKRVIKSQDRAARDAVRGEGAGDRGAAAPRAGVDGGGGVGGGAAQVAPAENHRHGLLQRGAVAAGGLVGGAESGGGFLLGRGGEEEGRGEKHGHGLLQRGAVRVAGSAGGPGSVGGPRPGGALGQKGESKNSDEAPCTVVRWG
jgi:hypothetical protein